MQAAAACVVLVREFSACVQRCEDDLKRRLLELLVLVDRNAATVVVDRARTAILMQRDFDLGAVPGEVLVDRVVDDFP